MKNICKYIILLILVIYVTFDRYEPLSLYSSKYLFQSIDHYTRKLYFFEYATKKKIQEICKKNTAVNNIL